MNEANLIECCKACGWEQQEGGLITHESIPVGFSSWEEVIVACIQVASEFGNAE